MNLNYLQNKTEIEEINDYKYTSNEIKTEVINTIQKENKIMITDNKLTEQQIEIIRNCLLSSNNRIAIFGRAGAGKSTIINHLIKEFEKRNKVVKTCAFTGLAADNINGITINKLASLPILKDVIENKIRKKEISEDIREADVIIIDEISMVPKSLYKALEKMIRLADFLDKKNRKIVLVGDNGQLICIESQFDRAIENNYDLDFIQSKECKKLDSVFTETSLVLDNWKVFNLTECMRQTDPVFLEILDKMRKGIYDSRINSMVCDIGMKQEYFAELLDENSGLVYLAGDNKTVNLVNTTCINNLKGEEKIYETLIEENLDIQEEINEKDAELIMLNKEDFDSQFIMKELRCKIGMKIIITTNDKADEQRFINGSRGKIIEMQDNIIKVQLLKNNNIVELKRFSTAQYLYYKNKDKILCSYKYRNIKQFPIIPAYALTVHKAQGMTLDKIILDPRNIKFTANLLYTMITRVRNVKDIILIREIRKNDIIVNPFILELNDKIENEHKIFSMNDVNKIRDRAQNEFKKRKENELEKCTAMNFEREH